MSRRARIVIPDYPHHLVQKGNNSQNVFLERNDYLKYLELLEKNARKYRVKILAYCLMQNHVHLLAIPLLVEALAEMMRAVAGGYSRYFNNKYDRKGRLWLTRFFSSVVDAQAYLWTVALYVERNPVRAGIVARAEDWEYSSARYHVLGKQDLIVDEPLFDESDMHEYRRLLKEGPPADEVEEIRTRTFASKPIGASEFLLRLATSFGFAPTRKVGRPRTISLTKNW